MSFDAIVNHLHFGKNAVFIWLAYGICLFSILIMHITARIKHRQLKQRLRKIKAWNKK